jgi:hypothetical protein
MNAMAKPNTIAAEAAMPRMFSTELVSRKQAGVISTTLR